MLTTKTSLGALAIKIHLAAWAFALVMFGLLVIEPKGWDWVAIVFGISVLFVALSAFFAVPVAVIQAWGALSTRRYWSAILFAVIALVALLSLAVWFYVQKQRP